MAGSKERDSGYRQDEFCLIDYFIKKSLWFCNRRMTKKETEFDAQRARVLVAMNSL